MRNSEGWRIGWDEKQWRTRNNEQIRLFTVSHSSLFIVQRSSLVLYFSYILNCCSYFLFPHRILFPILHCFSSFTVPSPSLFLVLHCSPYFTLPDSSLFLILHCFSFSFSVHLLSRSSYFTSLTSWIVVHTSWFLIIHCSSSFTVPHPSLFFIIHRS